MDSDQKQVKTITVERGVIFTETSPPPTGTNRTPHRDRTPCHGCVPLVDRLHTTYFN